uniref:SJCHGC02978 protein n=1 Tax=Schistosoma japonicum TaxID=6182 RepID=Q5D8W4_SCHJA|nr:SJCHGC02978 protein [Schistosoma japonicum]
MKINKSIGWLPFFLNIQCPTSLLFTVILTNTTHVSKISTVKYHGQISLPHAKTGRTAEQYTRFLIDRNISKYAIGTVNWQKLDKIIEFALRFRQILNHQDWSGFQDK